jgi:autotransporter-associated beta strand protein
MKRIRLALAATLLPATLSAQLYWNTNTSANTWTSANWGTTSSGPFTTAWANNNDVIFSATSTATFASTSIGNVTVNNGLNVNVTAGGTLSTNNAVRTFDVGTGSTLTWTEQAVEANSTSGFIKNGAGTWNIGDQNNAYTGGFTLNAGTVIVSGNNSLGTGVLNLNGGTIQSTGPRSFGVTSITIGGDFAYAGAGSVTFNAPVALGSAIRSFANNKTGGALTFSGVISGDTGGGLTFTSTQTGTVGTTLTGANTYTGGTTIGTNGRVVFASGSLGTMGAITVSDGSLSWSSGNTQDISSRLVMVNSTSALLDTGGNNITLASAIGNSSSGALTKSGAGTLTLSGANTYTGATTINNGTLALGSSGALASTSISVASHTTFDVSAVTGGFTLASGRTLGGAGTISGPVTVASGGIIAPGDSIGTATFRGGLTLNTGSILNFELGTTSDLIAVNGTLTGPGSIGGVTLNFSDSSGFTAGTYTLINYTTATGGFSASDFTIGSSVSGYTYNLALSGNSLQLTATTSAIPEPSTYAALAGTCALGLAFYRKRRRG